MKRPIDPQQEIVLSALYRAMSMDQDLADLFGDQPGPVISRLLRRDPIRVKAEDRRVEVDVEKSGVPCLSVHTDGSFSYAPAGNQMGYSRTFNAEYIGTLPAATEELTDKEAGIVAGTIVGAKIVQLLRDSSTLNSVKWDHLPICSEWIYEIEPESISAEPYVLPLHNLFGVDVKMTIVHSEEYPPYLVVDETVPLKQVDTDQTYAAPGGDLEHDSDHQITQV
jgi:hypothetical protein